MNAKTETLPQLDYADPLNPEAAIIGKTYLTLIARGRDPRPSGPWPSPPLVCANETVISLRQVNPDIEEIFGWSRKGTDHYFNVIVGPVRASVDVKNDHRQRSLDLSIALAAWVRSQTEVPTQEDDARTDAQTDARIDAPTHPRQGDGRSMGDEDAYDDGAGHDNDQSDEDVYAADDHDPEEDRPEYDNYSDGPNQGDDDGEVAT